ncbi:uncharacterized protein [Euphorbia lathyris]|uniref:uncharacterized protein n=1 Tax=Euphorbia lathyris TaxID=212925 RepID=UPI0033131B91
MAKNHASSPFFFSSTLRSLPSAPSESTPPSSPPSPSPSSSRSNSSFNSPYDSLSSGSRPSVSHSSLSHFPPAVCGPCAACKFHGRRCSEKCYLAAFFPPNDVHKFAVVDSVFGSGNVDKFLQQNSKSSYIPLLLLLRDTTLEDGELLSDSKNNTLSETDITKQLGASMDSDHIRELIQGMELAKQLKKHLSSESSDTTAEQLVERILSSFEKSLSIPNSSGLTKLQNDVALAVSASNDPTKSPIYMDASPATVNIDAVPKDSAKRRKASAIWKKHVRVSSKYEGPNDDGYSWRNYGQKDILGAKYPRSYYRCTYSKTQNCRATKQVQRSDKDLNVFEITYRGVHTCSHGQQSNSSASFIPIRNFSVVDSGFLHPELRPLHLDYNFDRLRIL